MRQQTCSTASTAASGRPTRRPVSLPEDGTRTLEYRASVGGAPVESSVGSVTLPVDRTAPGVSALASPPSAVGTVEEPVVVTLSASDATSGVAKIEYRLDEGEWGAYAAPLTFDEVGSALLEYRAVDVALNTSSVSSLSVVVSGPETPDASITVSAKTVVAGDTITVTGRGFGGEERVDLTLFSEPVLLELSAPMRTGASPRPCASRCRRRLASTPCAPPERPRGRSRRRG